MGVVVVRVDGTSLGRAVDRPDGVVDGLSEG